jgi:hypothetical protein
MTPVRLVRGSLVALILWSAAACSAPVMMDREELPESTAPPVESPVTAAPHETETLEPDPPAAEREAAPPPTSMPTVEEGGSEAGEAMLEGLLAVIRRLVAVQQALSEDEITVERVEAVEWPDASLGCPQPGMMYAQVVTPGYLVELEAEGETITVHTDTGRQVVICGDDGQPILPAIPIDPDEVLDGKPWIPVDG